MKKLKLTINGEVKTFDLPENGEYKCEVVNKYVPKVGDCVKASGNVLGCATFFKIVDIDYDGDIRAGSCVYLYIGKYTIDLCEPFFLHETNFTQITPEELKAKYAEAGYDWDYETNEVKPLKWMPKDGDECWGLDSFLQPRILTYNSNSRWILKQLKKRIILSNRIRVSKIR